jgi:DNA-binding response OmpR family regulator
MPDKRILIVDDDPDITEFMGDRLAAYGFDVQIVESARSCYEAVAARTPDLVLLDIQMPEISGLDALRELKRTHPDLPVLMVSAATAKGAMEEPLKLGAEGYVLKPFEPGDLMDKIHGILGSEGA